MTENEQIREMARVLYVAREHLCIGAECEFYMSPSTEEFDCRELWNAEKLYSAGYSKASEVAKVIFAEIEKLIIRRMIADTPLIDDRLITDIAELKKKYTEGEK